MDTGAASGSGHPLPDLNQVRTRRDLARFINEAADPLEVKKEIMEEEQQELMEYDSEDNFVECLDPLSNYTNQSMEDDEALLDEEGEEEGGDYEGEEVLEEEEEGQDGGDGEEDQYTQEEGGYEGDGVEDGGEAGAGHRHGGEEEMATAETVATGDNPTHSEEASVAAGKEVGQVADPSSGGENRAAPPSDIEAGAAGGDGGGGF